MSKKIIFSFLMIIALLTSCKEVEKENKETTTKVEEKTEVKTQETEQGDLAKKMDKDMKLVTDIVPIEVDRSNYEASEGTIKESGSIVSLDYVGKTDDGVVFDTSKQKMRTPLVFTTGENRMLPEFEKAIIGMKTGESKKFTIPEGKGYEINSNLVQEIPSYALKSYADSGLELKVGTKIPTLQGAIKIVEIKNEGETVVIDQNPPIAGKALNFEVTILSVADREEVEKSLEALKEEIQTNNNDSEKKS